MLLFKTYRSITRGKILENSIKTKIIATTWNDEFELLDGSYSMSDIQDDIEYIMKSTKHYIVGHTPPRPPPFSEILPFLEILDVPTFYRPIEKTRSLNDSFN